MKSKTKLTISIDEKLLEIFNKYCDEKCINKSKLISNFINNQIENYKNKNKN